MNIHVSNLHPNFIETDLKRLFSSYGEVTSIEVIKDKLTNRSRGRAFIQMASDAEGKKAILNLEGTDIMGKIIRVSEVRYDPSHSTHSFSSKE